MDDPAEAGLTPSRRLQGCVPPELDVIRMNVVGPTSGLIADRLEAGSSLHSEEEVQPALEMSLLS